MRHVVKHIIAPYGEPIDERPPVPTLEERLAEVAAKRAAKDERRAALKEERAKLKAEQRAAEEAKKALKASTKVIEEARRALQARGVAVPPIQPTQGDVD